jgi:hypothetical protein
VLKTEEHPTSTDFNEYYHKTVRNYHAGPASFAALPDEDTVLDMFAEAIAPLTKKLTQRLGHAPTYKTLWLPSVFGKRANLVSVKALRNEAGRVTVRDGAYDQVMCSAWRFYEGENIGREPYECNESGPRNVVLVLEYMKDYLLVRVNELAWELKPTFVSEKITFRKELGTLRLKVSRFVASTSGSSQSEQDRDLSMLDYMTRLGDFIDNFVDNNVLSDTPAKTSEL